MDTNVQHLILIADLKDDAKWMIKENKKGIFNKILQVESTSQMGWLLYSMSTLDLTLLAKVLTDKCGGIQITLRFKYINTDKYESDRDERKKWMAVHIEVDTNDRNQVARRIYQIYNSSLIKFSLSIHMCLVS